MQSKVFSSNKTLNLRGKVWDLSIPRVMGILNVTPDSFFDGGQYAGEDAMLQQVEKMLAEGAHLIDIGGHSTRPGASEVPEEEERNRIIVAITRILREFPEAMLSIDTFRASVARDAVAAGAVMINDVSGGGLDNAMFDVVAELGVPYVVMHLRGTPQTMNELTHYDNLLKDTLDYFHKRLQRLTQLGVKDVLIDPGFGFAKTAEQNFELLQRLGDLHILGKPMMVGLSRKSMIWRTLSVSPQEALNGSTVLHTIALLKGASVLRVHDVKEAMECVKLVDQLKASPKSD